MTWSNCWSISDDRQIRSSVHILLNGSMRAESARNWPGEGADEAVSAVLAALAMPVASAAFPAGQKHQGSSGEVAPAPPELNPMVLESLGGQLITNLGMVGSNARAFGQTVMHQARTLQEVRRDFSDVYDTDLAICTPPVHTGASEAGAVVLLSCPGLDSTARRPGLGSLRGFAFFGNRKQCIHLSTSRAPTNRTTQLSLG